MRFWFLPLLVLVLVLRFEVVCCVLLLLLLLLLNDVQINVKRFKGAIGKMGSPAKIGNGILKNG